MKKRAGFVTNSSAVNFMIVNTSNKDLTMADFLRENMGLIDSYRENALKHEYSAKNVLEMSNDEMLEESEEVKIESKDIVLYDVQESYDFLDEILAYADTKGGVSKNFIWKKDE